MKTFVMSLLFTVILAASAYSQVTAEEAAKTALNVGAKMPSFTLTDPFGKRVSSAELLKQGNVVLVFYRGGWCPFCNRYLQTLQRDLARIKQAGGVLVAISVENADKAMAVSKKNELTFTVLSDPDLATARRFGLVYDLPEATNERYKANGLDVAKNNEMKKAELPISATYIVDRQANISWAHVEPDYRRRPTVDEIVTALGAIK